MVVMFYVKDPNQTLSEVRDHATLSFIALLMSILK